ncbi:MAG TPA: hypothetical protein VLL08_19170 [Kineosporiaceae bacterium]|nr:hypothetical protein [Kineosporiaceae bacterium]
MNVSGPYEVPVPSEHPNNDLLADLAAEVLPDDLAGHVQAHVMECSRCAALLADAESVRAMLLQIEPEQMPAEVLTRLERAFQIARREDEAAAAAGDGSETRVLGRLSLGTDAGRTDPGRRIARSGNVAGAGRIVPSAGLTGSIAAGGAKTGRLSRMSAPAQSARRQAIEEQKADKPSRLAKFAPALKIAAGVLVVVGVGATLVQVRDGLGGQSEDSAASGVSAAANAPIIAPVQSTKTDYAKKSLPTQVKTLITSSQKLLAESPPEQPKVEAQDSDETARASSPKASGSAFARESSDPTVQGQLLRSPEALRACLVAIGAEQVQPLAVDLARYAGREAAVIVLPGDGGGYDVWVVARDCRADSDGAIDFVHVKS